MPQPAPVIRNSLPHHNQLYVLWTALHLLEGNRRVLISVAQSPELLMKRYAEAFTLPGWQAVQPFALQTDADDPELGSASVRERVCQSVYLQVVAVPLKNNNKQKHIYKL